MQNGLTWLLLFIKCQRNEEAEKLQPFLLYVNFGVTSKAIRYNIWSEYKLILIINTLKSAAERFKYSRRGYRQQKHNTLV